jgi:hypothetical protein
VGLISCFFTSLEHRVRLPFHISVAAHSLILCGFLPRHNAHAARGLVDAIPAGLEDGCFLLQGGDPDLERLFLRDGGEGDRWSRRYLLNRELCWRKEGEVERCLSRGCM